VSDCQEFHPAEYLGKTSSDAWKTGLASGYLGKLIGLQTAATANKFYK